MRTTTTICTHIVRMRVVAQGFDRLSAVAFPTKVRVPTSMIHFEDGSRPGVPKTPPLFSIVNLPPPLERSSAEKRSRPSAIACILTVLIVTFLTK